MKKKVLSYLLIVFVAHIFLYWNLSDDPDLLVMAAQCLIPAFVALMAGGALYEMGYGPRQELIAMAIGYGVSYLLSVLFHKKFVFIETFGRANMPTVAGKMMEKHSDLFIVQWESQKKHYKKAIYGGCLY